MRDISTEELCKGKKVLLFAVPGAFTPTCSLKHVPGFVDKADELKTKVGLGRGRAFRSTVSLSLLTVATESELGGR